METGSLQICGQVGRAVGEAGCKYGKPTLAVDLKDSPLPGRRPTGIVNVAGDTPNYLASLPAVYAPCLVLYQHPNTSSITIEVHSFVLHLHVAHKPPNMMDASVSRTCAFRNEELTPAILQGANAISCGVTPHRAKYKPYAAFMPRPLGQVSAPVARGASHRTVVVLFTYGSSGRQVITPVAGRFATSTIPMHASGRQRGHAAIAGVISPSLHLVGSPACFVGGQ